MEFHSGALLETHDLVAYQSLGVSRGWSLTYDSLRADPRPIVHIGYDDVDPAIYSVPGALRLIAKLSVARGSFQFELPGFAGGQFGLTGGEHSWRIPQTRGPVDAALQVDLSDQPTGRYDYSLTSGILGFAGSRGFIGSSTTSPGSLLHVNSIQSPFGSGWGLAGLVQLVENPDGSVLWVDGDGSEMLFKPPAAPGAPYMSPPGDFSVFEKVGGLFRRTEKDQTVWTFDAANRLAGMRDRNNNLTQFQYSAGGLLTKIIDPVGLETTFANNGTRITSITDPAGRVTQLTYDAAGNLTRVTDPDGTFRTWTYDAGHHMTGETDKRGNVERESYDFAGRLVSTTQKDGAVRQISPVQTRGLFPVGATVDPINAPLAAGSMETVALFADANGHVVQATLDGGAQYSGGTDGEGRLPSLGRNSQNLVTSQVDGRGHATGNTYDAQGNLIKIVDEVSAGGVLAFYTFENGAADVTGGGHDGTISGATVAAGFEGNGFSFDGVNDFIQLPLNTSPSVHPQLTIGAWVKANSANGIQQIISVSGPCYERSIDIDFRGGGIGYSAYTGQDTEVLGAGAVTTGAWTFVAAVYDQDLGQVTLYVDGQVFSEPGTLEDGDEFVRLGSSALRGEFFGGTIDNVFFIASALSAAQIAAIRAGGAGAVLGTSDSGMTMTYDATFNQTTSITDELGRQTLYAIDPATGNTLSETRVVGAVGGGDDVVTQFTYTPQGLIDTVTDPLGRVTNYDYDARGRLITVTKAQGTPDQGVVRMEYDTAGNVTATIDENGNRTQFAYDSLNRVTQITKADPDGGGPLTSPVVTFSYDAMGNLATRTDPRGNATDFDYDVLDRLTTVTDALNGVSRLSYDAVGNVIATVDELGRETRHRYDSRNRRVETIDPDGGRTFLAYDLDGNITAVTDQNGHTTRYTYDARGRLTRATDALGNVTRYAYDLGDQLIAVTDRNGHRSQFAYDDLGRLTTETNALGDVMRQEYDAASNVIRRIDELNRATEFAYDARYRVTDVTNPLGNTMSYSYDAAGNRTGVTDELGRTTQFAFDGLNRLIRTTDPLGGVRTLSYDPNDNVLSVRDELNRTVQFQYDALNRRTRAIDPLGNAVDWAYDAVGNTVSVTDALNHATQFTYDVLDRVIRATDARGAATEYEYDAVGLLTRLTDATGNSTDYVYDVLNRPVEETNELGATRFSEYDSVGNLVSVTDRNGRVREFEYDELDRRTAEEWLDSSGTVVRTMSYTFDAAGQLTAASDPDSSFGYSYDADGRLASATNAGTPGVPAVAFAYTYDAADNMLTRADTIGGQARGTNAYQYDALDRVTRITQSGSGVTNKRVDFDYNAASQLTGVTRFTDLAGTQLVAASTYGYDAAGRLTGMAHTRNATTIAQYTWTFDAANRITQAITPDGTSNFTYDVTDQLTGGDHSFQSDENYSYDASGNRTNAGYVTDPNNRLRSDGAFDYQYDAEGNRTRRTNIATGEVTDYEWDHRNRLTRIATTSAGAVTKDIRYSYDVNDRRIVKSVDNDGAGPSSAGIERFVYDGSHIALSFDGAGAQTHRYLHGPAIDQILADENDVGALIWSLPDHEGTVRDLVDSAGAIENHLVYDSFGRITAESDPSVEHVFAYMGREFDAESGLYFFRARYYDPATGRFLSEDSVAPSVDRPVAANEYQFVLNNPLSNADPYGLDTIPTPAQGGYFYSVDLSQIPASVRGEVARMLERASRGSFEGRSPAAPANTVMMPGRLPPTFSGELGPLIQAMREELGIFRQKAASAFKELGEPGSRGAMAQRELAEALAGEKNYTRLIQELEKAAESQRPPAPAEPCPGTQPAPGQPSLGQRVWRWRPAPNGRFVRALRVGGRLLLVYQLKTTYDATVEAAPERKGHVAATGFGGIAGGVTGAFLVGLGTGGLGFLPALGLVLIGGYAGSQAGSAVGGALVPDPTAPKPPDDTPAAPPRETWGHNF